MGRKRKIRTPAREFAAKCGRSGTSIDPQTKTLLRHLIMLDDSVKYVYEDFARPNKGIPLAKLSRGLGCSSQAGKAQQGQQEA